MSLPNPIANTLCQSLSAALSAKSYEDALPHWKRLLAAVWAIMEPSERLAFLRAADSEQPFLTFKARWPELKDKTLENAAQAWGAVAIDIRLHGDEFERHFVGSVEKLLKQHRKPSDKQIPIMKRMYLDWKAAKEAGTDPGDITVMEDE